MLGQEYSNVRKVFALLREINIRPLYLLLPITLALTAALFEGLGMGLLVPLLSGFLDKNFGFLRDLPYIGDALQYLPESITSDDKMLFGVLLTGFMVIFILKNTLRYASIVCVAYFAERSLHHLRKTLFTRFLSFGKLYFDTTNIGHHNTLLMEHSRLAIRPISLIDKYMNALFSLTVYFIVMLLISWQLTLFALPLFALLNFAVKFMVRAIKAHSKSIVARGNELGKKAIEILTSMPLVKAYRFESEEQKRYTEVSDAKAKLDFRVRMLQALLLPLQETITLIAVFCIFVGALYFLGRENIGTESGFIVYFYIVLNASSKFGTLMSFKGMMATATGPLNEVFTVLNDDEKHVVRSGTKTFEGVQKAIECKDLTFRYGSGEPVLKDISFSVPHGKMTAIVGPTGSGKSTMIHLLMRYYDCPENAIFIDGEDIREFTLDSYLDHVALVSQETFLLHDSMRNNITYGLTDVPEEAVVQAVERARLTELVEQLPEGLDTLIGDRGVKLSGGEKQRVSIARALLKEAEILILDEATSSLDSKTEKLIQEAIDEAVRDRTSIVIAHRLSTIQHADSILVLQDGEIVERGTPQTLLDKKGVFYELWEEQKF